MVITTTASKQTSSCAVVQVRADTIIFIHVLKLIRRFGNILNLHVVMKKSVIINLLSPYFVNDCALKDLYDSISFHSLPSDLKKVLESVCSPCAEPTTGSG